jgi:hypothetical protein
MITEIEEKKLTIKANGINGNDKKEKTIDEIWDEDLADQDSPKVQKLIEMSENCIRRGKVSNGGFDRNEFICDIINSIKQAKAMHSGKIKRRTLQDTFNA